MTNPSGNHYAQAVARAEQRIAQWLHPPLPQLGWLPSARQLGGLPSLVRIRGARLPIGQRADDPAGAAPPILASLRGLSAQQRRWFCLAVGYCAGSGESALWLGDQQPDLQPRLAAMHPALVTEGGAALPGALQELRGQRSITGIPATQSTEQRYQPQLEGLMALRGDFDWLCSIWFRLAPEDLVHQLINATLAEQNDLAPYLQAELVSHAMMAAGGRGSIQRAIDLCDLQIERLHAGLTRGMWQAAIVVDAPQEAVDTVAAQAMALFSGRAMLEPLRSSAPTNREWSDIRPAIARPVNSDELGALVTIPRVEQYGYRIQSSAGFDVDVGATLDQRVIALGRVVDVHGEVARHQYTIALPRMARHVLVAGMTGSGKSNTCKGLLGQLAAHEVPFLVIEPAKAEYRSLGQVRVLTPGDERSAPMRLNPFEVPMLSRDGAPEFASVQGHIDHLKSVFSAAFVLYAPMPYVLERALHDVYTERGWNLTSNVNPRAQSPDASTRDRIFPTLGDLARRIEALVPELGYDMRAEMDIRAGLLARIASLRVGARGLLFDCRRSSPTIHALLAKPTVVELEHLANDEEKTFAMGLLLVLLYEYRILQMRVRQLGAGVAQQNPELAHVVLIEEAHRLLGERHSANTGDRADAAGQTVATFSNMLAEMRAYGQGFIIADQIPGQLAPAVVKNTEQKIIHRLAARDDRELVGATANLSPEQERFIAALPQGVAVAYGGSDDRPVLVQVAPFSGVAGRIGTHAGLPPPLPGCATHCAAWRRDRACPDRLRQIGRGIAATVEPFQLPGIFAAAASGQPYAAEHALRERINRMVDQRLPGSTVQQPDAAIVRTCTHLHLVEDAASICETMYPEWCVDHAALLQWWLDGQGGAALAAGLRQALRSSFGMHGPFASCGERCRSACLYRPFAREFSASHRARVARRTDLTQVVRLVQLLQDRGRAYFVSAAPAQAGQANHDDLALCLALHLTASHEDPEGVIQSL